MPAGLSASPSVLNQIHGGLPEPWRIMPVWSFTQGHPGWQGKVIIAWWRKGFIVYIKQQNSADFYCLARLPVKVARPLSSMLISWPDRSAFCTYISITTQFPARQASLPSASRKRPHPWWAESHHFGPECRKALAFTARSRIGGFRKLSFKAVERSLMRFHAYLHRLFPGCFRCGIPCCQPVINQIAKCAFRLLYPSVWALAILCAMTSIFFVCCQGPYACLQYPVHGLYPCYSFPTSLTACPKSHP